MRRMQHSKVVHQNIWDPVWRIELISWKPEGIIGRLKPNAPDTWVFIVFGLVGIVGIILLASFQIAFIPTGLAVSTFGLSLLMLSRFVVGYFSYKNYVRVDGNCMDHEVREIDSPDRIISFIYHPTWAPRLLCEYVYQGKNYRVTPVICHNTNLYSEISANDFLKKRIGPDNNCTLWINPKNPLQTIFHKKPWIACYD